MPSPSSSNRRRRPTELACPHAKQPSASRRGATLSTGSVPPLRIGRVGGSQQRVERFKFRVDVLISPHRVAGTRRITVQFRIAHQPAELTLFVLERTDPVEYGVNIHFCRRRG